MISNCIGYIRDSLVSIFTTIKTWFGHIVSHQQQNTPDIEKVNQVSDKALAKLKELYNLVNNNELNLENINMSTELIGAIERTYKVFTENFTDKCLEINQLHLDYNHGKLNNFKLLYDRVIELVKEIEIDAAVYHKMLNALQNAYNELGNEDLITKNQLEKLIKLLKNECASANIMINSTVISEFQNKELIINPAGALEQLNPLFADQNHTQNQPTFSAIVKQIEETFAAITKKMASYENEGSFTKEYKKKTKRSSDYREFESERAQAKLETHRLMKQMIVGLKNIIAFYAIKYPQETTLIQQLKDLIPKPNPVIEQAVVQMQEIYNNLPSVEEQLNLDDIATPIDLVTLVGDACQVFAAQLMKKCEELNKMNEVFNDQAFGNFKVFFEKLTTLKEQINVDAKVYHQMIHNLKEIHNGLGNDDHAIKNQIAQALSLVLSEREKMIQEQASAHRNLKINIAEISGYRNDSGRKLIINCCDALSQTNSLFDAASLAENESTFEDVVEKIEQTFATVARKIAVLESDSRQKIRRMQQTELLEELESNREQLKTELYAQMDQMQHGLEKIIAAYQQEFAQSALLQRLRALKT